MGTPGHERTDPVTARTLAGWQETGPPSVFLNYRKPDRWAAITFDILMAPRFGEESIFRATRSIAPGDDYKKLLLAAAAGAKLMVVFVGDSWAESLREYDHQEEPPWVVREIHAAQEHGVPMLPVTLTDEPLPDAASLPRGIDPAFSDISDIRFRPWSFEDDARAIGDVIGRMIPGLPASG